MLVEPESLCWLTGRMVPARDGATWAEEFARFPALKSVVRDAGTGLGKGLSLERARRHAAWCPDLDDPLDVFHTLREGARALRTIWAGATRALERAEAAQQQVDRRVRQGQSRTGYATQARRHWHRAERIWDQAAAAETAWGHVRAAFEYFTPEGLLNDRHRAEAVVAAALPHLIGPTWAKTRRLLAAPREFHLPGSSAAAVGRAGVGARGSVGRVGPRRIAPAAVASGGNDARGGRHARLGVGAHGPVSQDPTRWAGAGPSGRVRGVLRGVWRASSLVECVNSVVRMQQARHRKLSQGLLDLKRLYWNLRRFRAGRRKDQTPYGLLGLKLPDLSFWEFLKLTPDQLRHQLSAPRHAP